MNKTAYIGFYVPDEYKLQVRILAATSGLNMSDFVREKLADTLGLCPECGAQTTTADNGATPLCPNCDTE